MGTPNTDITVIGKDEQNMAATHPLLGSSVVSSSQSGIRKQPVSPLIELTAQDAERITHDIQVDRKKVSLGEILQQGER